MTIFEKISLVMGSIMSGGGIVAVINYYSQRGKMTAEARKMAAEAENLFDQRYERLVNSLTKRIDELETENSKLLQELRSIRESSLRMEYKLNKISQLFSGVMDEDTRKQEPFRSIFEELGKV